MCLLWVLLQFVVLAMYWDAPPTSSEGGAVMVEMKQEEANEEEVPLMGSGEEPLHTYRAVSYNQVKTSATSETQPVDGAPAVSSLFKNFSARGGELSGPMIVSSGSQWEEVSLPMHVFRICRSDCPARAHTNTHTRTNIRSHSPGL